MRIAESLTEYSGVTTCFVGNQTPCSLGVEPGLYVLSSKGRRLGRRLARLESQIRDNRHSTRPRGSESTRPAARRLASHKSRLRHNSLVLCRVRQAVSGARGARVTGNGFLKIKRHIPGATIARLGRFGRMPPKKVKMYRKKETGTRALWAIYSLAVSKFYHFLGFPPRSIANKK